jgi:histidine triad (HIT) family protein
MSHVDEVKSHQPAGYRCPFCSIVSGGEDERLIVLRDDTVVAVLALQQQIGNHGALLVFPKCHIENLYAVPDALGSSLFTATRRMAIALKEAFDCDGITIRQNNEPAGDQDVWHYHVHVVPRYIHDNFHHEPRFAMPVAERIAYAERLRKVLGECDA